MKLIKSFVLILALATILISVLFNAVAALGEQSKSVVGSDMYPTFFKVYSKDGRESLTATCNPIQPYPPVNQISCKFINVRFQPPDLQKIVFPPTVEDLIKADPSLKNEDPQKIKKELEKGMEKAKQDICSSPEERKAIEKRIHNPVIGPKRKKYYQQLIASCAYKDPSEFFKILYDIERKTCNLWVDEFTLEFIRVRDGQWLYKQEKPGFLSKVLKIYELTGNGVLWTLSETRVPTEGAKEKPKQTVWRWDHYKDYELPCDFVSHSMVQHQ